MPRQVETKAGADRRQDAAQWLDTVCGDGSGFACGATATDPYLNEGGKYAHGHRRE